MTFSYYLFKFPYVLIGALCRLVKKSAGIIVYCSDPLDYIILEPVFKHLPPIQFVAKTKKTAAFLRRKGIATGRLPSFPEAVIMCRHATHKFPDKKIIKIGLRHGAYHFKEFAGTDYYNAFNLYLVTSEREVEIASQKGIRTVKAVGFPKLDSAFNGKYNDDYLARYRQQAGIDPKKKTLIFTSTWDKSRMSAIDRWIDKIDGLSQKYNVLITVHPWQSEKYKRKLRAMSGIYFIDEPDVLPYLMISDLLVGDTSSIIAEFCALDKPIITFKIPTAKRLVPEITDLLREISIQIDNFEELEPAIAQYRQTPDLKREQRQHANQTMFGSLDGRAGWRAAQLIKNLIPALQLEQDNK